MSVRAPNDELERVGYVVLGRVQGVAFGGGSSGEPSN